MNILIHMSEQWPVGLLGSWTSGQSPSIFLYNKLCGNLSMLHGRSNLH